ncbi:MAG TPA: hypothetical protein VF629_03795 [Hymenobacter sp.]|jgi:hypothetical protein|uniref:hypothetical protein n=1 Tax=Hymenobacter sp. TaxID=1898978 RepID=UPI002EDAFE52
MNPHFAKLVDRLDRHCPVWQTGLRRSVRLYLALREPGAPAQRIEALLRAVERVLLGHLLHQDPGMSPAQAWGVLEHAQGSFLSDPARVQQLRARRPGAQAPRD